MAMRYFLECGFEVVATPEQVFRWNSGNSFENDFDGILVLLPTTTKCGHPDSVGMTINQCAKAYDYPDYLGQKIISEDLT